MRILLPARSGTPFASQRAWTSNLPPVCGTCRPASPHPFPQRVNPMLPEKMSNGQCSLNPDVDRLCMVCEMRVMPDGEIAQ